MRPSVDSQGPGHSLMPWAMAIETQRARSGRRNVSSDIFYVFFCILVGGFLGGFVLLWPIKIIINRCPVFRSMKLGLVPSCALVWRAKIVALDVSYNLVSSTALEVKNSRRYILFHEASLKWTYIYVHSCIPVKERAP